MLRIFMSTYYVIYFNNVLAAHLRNVLQFHVIYKSGL